MTLMMTCRTFPALETSAGFDHILGRIYDEWSAVCERATRRRATLLTIARSQWPTATHVIKSVRPSAGLCSCRSRHVQLTMASVATGDTTERAIARPPHRRTAALETCISKRSWNVWQSCRNAFKSFAF